MNISAFSSDGNVFVNCEYVKSFAFKNAASWVKYALLPVICAIFGISQGSYAHFYRFGCLLPQIDPA